MASAMRNKSTTIEILQQLSDAPYQFGYFEALRQIECLHPQKPRLGQSRRASDDAIRLAQAPSLKFASSTLEAYDANHGGKSRMQVNFFGMFGPNGPLPLHMTEYARQRLRHAKDPVLVDFMDLFHHRLLSLFYRAWANKEPTVHQDRPQQDRFALYVGALLGIGPHALRNRDRMPDHTKLHFAGHLGCHTRHAQGLASILSAFFHFPVRIEEFIGEWLAIPTADYGYLRAHKPMQLGRTAVVGTRSWQRQHKFRIRLGPLSLEDYTRMLPNGRSALSLVDIVRNYTGFEFSWDVNLVLDKHQVPKARLGQYCQLGWTSWLKSGESREDADDLMVTLEGKVASGA